MPHFYIDYSANLEAVVDIAALCETIRDTAARIDAFPTPGIRVRAFRADHIAIADGDLKHGYIHLHVRIREGRDEDVKKDAIERVFNALKEFMTPAMQTSSIALSAELNDITAALSPKFGNIRDHL